MPRPAPRFALALAAALALAIVPAGAQDAKGKDAAPAASSAAGRLFLGFDREATLADRQWWEGQIEIADDDVVDVAQVRLVVALQPFKGFEFGGKVGFGSTDTPGGILDGDGATDLDLWAKVDLGSFSGTRLAVGAIGTVPTGDDSVGLGTDAFALGGFLSMRRPTRHAVFHADIGARVQDDGRVFGVDIDGRTSGFFGFGAIIPLDDRLDLIAEGRFESERFRGADPDTRVLGGIDWRVAGRGRLRAAVGVGVTDGAPDVQLIAGWAAMF